MLLFTLHTIRSGVCKLLITKMTTERNCQVISNKFNVFNKSSEKINKNKNYKTNRFVGIQKQVIGRDGL